MNFGLELENKLDLKNNERIKKSQGRTSQPWLLEADLGDLQRIFDSPDLKKKFKFNIDSSRSDELFQLLLDRYSLLRQIN